MRNSKRYLSVLLCFVMVLSQLCLFSFPSKAASYNEVIWFEEGDEITLAGINDSTILNIVGDDYDFTSIEWKSDDTSVAVVDDNGNVTAQGKGSTYIYAIARKDKASPSEATPDEASPSITKVAVTARCKVTVEIPVSAFSIITPDLSLGYKNETKLIEYEITPEDASNIKVDWISSNSNVVTVDKKGKVTAISEGTAIITGITQDSQYSDNCSVTVDFSAEPPIDGNYDILAPTIDSIEILTSEVSAPGTVKVKVDITEEGAGLTELRIGVSPSDPSLSSNRYDQYGYGYYSPGNAYSGSYEISIPILNENAPMGEWFVSFVYVEDAQGNVSTNYDGERVTFSIISSKRTDTVLPQITNIEVLTPEVKIPGKVKIKVDVIEEDSGVKEMRFKFSHKELGNGVSGNDYQFGYAYFNPEDTKTGSYIVETYLSNSMAASGEWTISWVYIMDAQGNLSYDYNGTPVTFTVDNPLRNDFVKPQLKAIHITPEEIIAPGVIKISLDIIEEDSGMAEISFCLRNDVTKKEFYYHMPVNQNGGSSGVYTQIIPMNTFINAGNWGVEWLTLKDKQGNYVYYGWPVGSVPDDVEGNASFHVKNDMEIQLQTSLANSRLPELIEGMSDNGVALLNPDTNIIRPEIFNAIIGTNKKIVINGDGIQWVFDGKDIESENIKPININTSISIINGIDYGLDEQILQVIFQNNGTLPGIAKIRLKSDYLYAKYNASGNLVLSWLNNDGVNVESDDVLCEEDTYTEFYISHNSTFLISSQTPDEKLADIILTPPTKNNYKVGENLDLSGMSLFAVYESGAKRKIADYDISGFNNQVVGNQIITVKYGNKEASFTINIEENKNTVPDNPSTEIPDDNNHNNGGSSNSGGSGGGGGSSSGSRKAGSATIPSNSTPGKWVQDENGWWFQKTDGSYPKDEWIINNNLWYHFDSRGYVQTGWIEVNSVKYYLNQDGSMVSNNWILFDNKWYYFDQSGTMRTGWIQWNNLWYYLNLDGSMASGVNTPDGYQVDENGVWVL